MIIGIILVICALAAISFIAKEIYKESKCAICGKDMTIYDENLKGLWKYRSVKNDRPVCSSCGPLHKHMVVSYHD